MKVKITPEMEASMRETQAQIDADMKDPSFRAEFEAADLRYKLLEAFAALIGKASYVRRFAAQPKRQRLTFDIAFGGGEPAKICNQELVFA